LLSPAIISDGNWHRIGLVWDGSYRHLYVDGTEVAKDAASLSGLIDDVRIYNRAVKP